jgi:hypothetical protein
LASASRRPGPVGGGFRGARAERLAPILLAFAALLAGVLPGFAASKEEYQRTFRALRPVLVYSGEQYRQALENQPDRHLQVSGVISGIARCASSGTLILLRLVDNQTVELSAQEEPAEARPGSRVKIIAAPASPVGSGPLELKAITWEDTPLQQVLAATRSKVTRPPTQEEIREALSAAERARAGRRLWALPSRGASQLAVIKRAIALLNKGLKEEQADLISRGIVSFSERSGVDPFFVAAVVAAESRFNPGARSPKGAMGLGQLMPGTARSHGINNPWDPLENLFGSVKILRENLERYSGNPLQTQLALAAYNAGHGAVSRHGGVPPYQETRNYIWKVYEYYCWLYGIPPEPRR